MSEPKKVIDREGDLWERGDDELYGMPIDDWVDRRHYEELEEDWGPLKVIEEPVKAQIVTGLGDVLREYTEAPTEPVRPLEYHVYDRHPWNLAKPLPTDFSYSKESVAMTVDGYEPRNGRFVCQTPEISPIDNLMTGALDAHAGRVLSVEEDTDVGFVVPQKVLDKAQSASGEDFPDNVLEVFAEAYNVLLKKNADYGPRNIADSPGGPLNGIMVRMYDKSARLRNLIETGADPENEALRDSFLDMANYSLIAMMVLDGNWPGMENE